MMASVPWKTLKRGKSHKKALAEGKLVETANDLSTPDFMQTYAPPRALCATNDEEILRWTDGTNIERGILEACLDLIERTSADDYERSELGWSRSKKRKEMVLPDLKYFLLLKSIPPGQVEGNAMLGFVSFMVTYEDGDEVVYIYEIHFLQELQGKGHGRRLMSFVEAIGREVGVEKAMLTVFKSNNRAVKWYEKLGYAEDEFSPEPRKLRNGTVKEPTYVILSKTLQDKAG